MDRSVLSLRDAAELETGDVTIGCVFSAVHHFLPPVIRAFRERHPRVLVRIIEEGADEVLASVKHGEADLAVNYIGMQDPEVEFAPLLKEPYVLACPAAHPLARRRSLAWQELASYPLARVSHASRNRLLIDQALAELPPLPRPIIEVRHVSTLIGLVESGLGAGGRAATHAAAGAGVGGRGEAGAAGDQPHDRDRPPQRPQPLAGRGRLRPAADERRPGDVARSRSATLEHGRARHVPGATPARAIRLERR